jgi:hypothetical protein
VHYGLHRETYTRKLIIARKNFSMIGQLWEQQTSLFFEGHVEKIILNNFQELLTVSLQCKRR